MAEKGRSGRVIVTVSGSDARPPLRDVSAKVSLLNALRILSASDRATAYAPEPSFGSSEQTPAAENLCPNCTIYSETLCALISKKASRWIKTEACSASTPAITDRLQVKALTFTGRRGANQRSGLTANCRAALPPIIGAISSSGISASRSLAMASQALVVS